MINLEWFRTFKVIYEAGTLSAAAKDLFISQPGVSLHLSSLESFAGHRLFDRDTRKMVATERGTMLYNFIIDHMNKLEEAEKLFHSALEEVLPFTSTLAWANSSSSVRWVGGASCTSLASKRARTSRGVVQKLAIVSCVS